MAPGFTAPGPINTFKGFAKVEVLLTQNLNDYDELNVNMYWESIENFNSWRNSDAFQAAYKPRTESETKESPILGSEMITYEVVSTKDRAE